MNPAHRMTSAEPVPAAAATRQQTPLVLRVLSGPRRGATAELPCARVCEIASGAPEAVADADVALLDPASPPVRLRLTAQQAAALVEVLVGEVALDGEMLPVGSQAVWRAGRTLQLGRCEIAFGAVDANEQVGDPDAARPPAGSAAPAAPPSSASSPSSRPLKQRPEVWLAATGALLLSACVASFGLAHSASPSTRPAASADASSPAPEGRVSQAVLAGTVAEWQQALGSAGFGGVVAINGPDGRLRLTGRLAQIAQRKRLDAWLANRSPRPLVEVHVDEALAHQVAEGLRVNGIAATTRVVAPGRIEASVSEPDLQLLTRGAEAVRRDIAGLDELHISNAAPAPSPPEPQLPSDPNQRITALVPGDMAHVVTADGSRYFVGAVLPNGHRLAAVSARRITLERDGHQASIGF